MVKGIYLRISAASRGAVNAANPTREMQDTENYRRIVTLFMMPGSPRLPARRDTTLIDELVPRNTFERASTIGPSAESMGFLLEWEGVWAGPCALAKVFEFIPLSECIAIHWIRSS